MSEMSISLPATSKNIKELRKFAHEKGYSLQKVRNENLWNIKDMQSARFVMNRESPMAIHEFLCKSDD